MIEPESQTRNAAGERILSNGLPVMIDAIACNLDEAVRDIMQAYAEEHGLTYPFNLPEYKARFSMTIDGEKYRWSQPAEEEGEGQAMTDADIKALIERLRNDPYELPAEFLHKVADALEACQAERDGIRLDLTDCNSERVSWKARAKDAEAALEKGKGK